MNTETKKPSRPATAAILPIDLALLEMLPDEGQVIGFKPIALQVRSIKSRPGFEEIAGSQISGRLKSLQFQGFAVTQVTFPIQQGLGWQRTAKGKKLLAENGRVAV